jgi:hypothetical protein
MKRYARIEYLTPVFWEYLATACICFFDNEEMQSGKINYITFVMRHNTIYNLDININDYIWRVKSSFKPRTTVAFCSVYCSFICSHILRQR